MTPQDAMVEDVEAFAPMPCCYYYIKFDEDNLPDFYTILLTAAARLVGSGPDVITLSGQDIL